VYCPHHLTPVVGTTIHYRICNFLASLGLTASTTYSVDCDGQYISFVILNQTKSAKMTDFRIFVIKWALLLVLWDEAPHHQNQGRKDIKEMHKNIEHGGENSYHAQ
jgi:hypothetical protein